MISAPRKRLYREAGIEVAEDRFAILLDGQRARTPAKAPLEVPTRALALAIAAEFEAQGERVDPATMPMTRLAAIAIDLVAPRHAEIAAAVANYAGTDLVCYRAEAPPALVERQRLVWQPLVEWAARRFGAPLSVTAGVVPCAQPDASLAALAAAVASCDAWALAALNLATAACGSVVVALALAESVLGADAAFAAAQLDESYEIEQWGVDDEQQLRRDILRDDIAAAARFLALLRG
ncbi:MAG TPA: ATP12 family chaperone protein [Stellaceae bacterium]|nr:ATP12 family chaperone protein [Stellaceae bacterium]